MDLVRNQSHLSLLRKTLTGIFLFTLSLGVSAGGEQPLSLEQRRTELLMREAELVKIKEKLDQGPYSASQIYQTAIPLIEKKDEEGSNKYLREWYEHQNEFQEKSATLSLDKQNYVMEKAHEQMLQLLNQLPHDLAIKYIQKYQKIYNQFYRPWDQYKSVVAVPDQRFRTYNFSIYLDNVRALLVKMKKHNRIAALIEPHAEKSSLSLLGAMKGLPGIISSATKIYARPHGKPTPLHTPLTSDGFKFFRRVGKVMKYHPTIEGRENLPAAITNPAPDAKEIYFFFPPHKDGVSDVVLLGNIKLPHAIVFGNPSTFAPKSVADVMHKTPEFISVGPWRGEDRIKPADKFFESLPTGISKNAVNFASGFVSNIGEFIPVRKELSERLIGQAIAKGYRPVIIPLAFEVGSSFLSLSGKVDERDVKAKILPPVPAEVVMKLKQLEEGKDAPKNVVSTAISAFWYENVKVHQELTMNELESRMQRAFGFPAAKESSAKDQIHCLLKAETKI